MTVRSPKPKSVATARSAELAARDLQERIEGGPQNTKARLLPGIVPCAFLEGFPLQISSLEDVPPGVIGIEQGHTRRNVELDDLLPREVIELHHD